MRAKKQKTTPVPEREELDIRDRVDNNLREEDAEFLREQPKQDRFHGKESPEEVFASATTRHRAYNEPIYVPAVKPTKKKPDPQPHLFGCELRDYQKEGLGWMLEREIFYNDYGARPPRRYDQFSPRGGILADEMGLGKTIQLIALILAHQPPNDWEGGGTLIVVPLILMEQWRLEFEKCAGLGFVTDYLVFMHRKTNRMPWKELRQYKVVLTTYDTYANRFKSDDEEEETDEEFRKRREKRRKAGKEAPERKTFTFRRRHWWRVVIDEAHTIRNPENNTSFALHYTEARYRWASTGTPIQNKWRDLYSLLRFLQVKPYGDWEAWYKMIEGPITAVENDQQNLYQHRNSSFLLLRNLVNQLVLRRTKLDRVAEPVIVEGGFVSQQGREVVDREVWRVDRMREIVYDITSSSGATRKILYTDASFFPVDTLVTLPSKTISYISIPFRDEDHMQMYYETLRELKVNMGGFKSQVTDVLTLLTRLRQIATHPDLVNETRVKRLKKRKEVFQSVPKFDYILGNLYQIREEEGVGIKSIVFSQFTRTLDLFELALDNQRDPVTGRRIWYKEGKAENINMLPGSRLYVRIDGTTSTKDRIEAIRLIQDETSGVDLILLSLQAAGVGLNITRASNVYFIEPNYNPALMNQAIDRSHRIGQTRPVTVKVLTTDMSPFVRGQSPKKMETVDGKIVKLQNYKTAVAESTLTKSRLKEKVDVRKLM